MEITPHSYIDIRLETNEDGNEVAQFVDFIRRAYTESARAGLKNTFEQDRPIIKKLMEGLNIKTEKDEIRTTAGDTYKDGR